MENIVDNTNDRGGDMKCGRQVRIKIKVDRNGKSSMTFWALAWATPDGRFFVGGREPVDKNCIVEIVEVKS